MSEETADLIRIMQAAHGMEVSRFEEGFLAQTLAKRASASDLAPAAYLERLAAWPGEARRLRKALGITFSEFFRDPLAFAVLEQQALPRLAKGKGGGELRVWSAGCAAGQEAFSLAILLEDLRANQGAPAGYRIFATDLDEDELAKGRLGIYERPQVRNVRDGHLRTYFHLQGDCVQVAETLRRRVDFSRHDLLDPRAACPPASIYGGFDVILCANLLFYYRPDLRRGIVLRLLDSLVQGGLLVTSQAERPFLEPHGALRPVTPLPAVFQLAAAGEKACD